MEDMGSKMMLVLNHVITLPILSHARGIVIPLTELSDGFTVIPRVLAVSHCVALTSFTACLIYLIIPFTCWVDLMQRNREVRQIFVLSN